MTPRLRILTKKDGHHLLKWVEGYWAEITVFEPPSPHELKKALAAISGILGPSAEVDFEIAEDTPTVPEPETKPE